MKKSFALLAGAAILFAACQKPAPAPDPVLTVNGETELTADIEGDIVTVEFTSNYDWTASIDVPEQVAALDVTEGLKGDGKVKVTVMKNEQPKNVVITLALTPKGGEPVNVTITQPGVDHIFVDVESLDFGVEGGTKTFTIDENIGYEIAYATGKWDWCEAVEGEKGVYTVTVKPNAGYGARQAYVKITGKKETGVDEEGNPVAEVIRVYFNQEGRATTSWKSTLSGLNISGGDHYRLAVSGDFLILTTGEKVHALSAKDGKYLAKIDLSAYGMVPESITSDDAGNILINVVTTNDAGTFMNVFVLPAAKVANISAIQPSDFLNPIKNWPSNIYSNNPGNIKARGDVTKDGVISVFFGTAHYYAAWQIKGGVGTDPVWGECPKDGNPTWSTINACVCPVGASLSEGLYFTGYNTNHDCLYGIMYCADPVTAKAWTALYDSALAGNENFSTLSVAEFNGKKFIATVQGAFFSYGLVPYLVLVDAATGEELYNASFRSGEFIAAMGQDVVLIPGNELKAYVVDGGSDSIACISFPKL